ncbi:MAG: ubiquinone biosynthesis accessory factor UbiJ [Pseudohongiellaceae bacterium]
MQTILLTTLENLINATLASDDHLAAQATTFKGKSLAIIVHQPSLKLRLSFHTGGINLTPLNDDATAETDAQLEGKLKDLLPLLLPNNQAQPLANPTLTLGGDILFIQELQHTAQSLDIDWEDCLTPLLGDVFTNSLTTLITSGQKLKTDAQHSIKRNLKHYLTEETATLVARPELTPLVQDIEALTLRIDRLAARTQLLADRRLH